MKSKIGGVHHLVTGLNGQGKTLYVVSSILRHIPGTQLERPGFEPVPRRLVVSGIKGLTLPHEWMDCPPIDPERFEDKWRDQVREPGDAPLDVPRQVQNWWCWVEPGDVVVIDECQRVFRPMASGRRIPMYIEKLETARHYGVQFLYITQHPQLLHTNVRSLVGPHEHVARLLGGIRTCIYQWDVCTNPDRIKTATKTFWKHDKSAFGMYESSQLHTSFSRRYPAAVFGLVGALFGLVVLGFYLKDRLFNPTGLETAAAGPAGPASQPAARLSPGRPPGPPVGQGQPGQPQQQTALGVSAPVRDREPFGGFGVHLVGTVDYGDRAAYTFSLSYNGRTLRTVGESDIHRAGYAWRSLAPCVGLLAYRGQERLVRCDAPAPVPQQPQQLGMQPAAPAASSPA